MTGIVAVPHIFQGNKRCDYCHRPMKRLYAMKMGDMTVWVCSGLHAEMARKNWQEKIDKGIKPGEPLPPSDFLETGEVDVNVNELGEKE